jgi:thiamine pyrophosphate-dependent acetolactate synthase large subunit-like protein
VTLADALARIVPHLRDEVCVHANGYVSRAGHAARDTDRCFYMIGSMGLASSIGLGLALAEPAKRILVLDGDGNVLMNTGTLCTIAGAAPPNLRHLWFEIWDEGCLGLECLMMFRFLL